MSSDRNAKATSELDALVRIIKYASAEAKDRGLTTTSQLLEMAAASLADEAPPSQRQSMALSSRRSEPTGFH